MHQLHGNRVLKNRLGRSGLKVHELSMGEIKMERVLML